MRLIPLANTPNQSFTVQLDNVRWELVVRTARGCMCADVDRDNVALLRGVRLVAGQPIIPYAYLQTGNFIFLSVDDALPDWSQFGVSQTLVYFSAAEIAALPAPRATDMLPTG